MTRPDPSRPTWLDPIVFVVLFVIAHFASDATRFHGFEDGLGSDEPEWIAASILHWRQLARGEAPAGEGVGARRFEDEESPNRWKHGYNHTTFGYMNPGLPKLLLGGILVANGHERASHWAFEKYVDLGPRQQAVQRIVAARRELEPAMPVARGVIVALSSLTAVLLFFAARLAFRGRTGWVAGVLAFAAWFAAPLFQVTASYIRTDYFMMPFALGALVLALASTDRLAGRRGRGPMLWTGLALGVLCGLAVASKLNGALTGFAITAWVLVLWAGARKETRIPFLRGPLPTLVVAGATSFAVFFAFNPVLWAEPIAGVGDILARWEKLIGVFQRDLEGTRVEVVHTLPERISLFTRKTLERDEPFRALTGLSPAVPLALGFVALCLTSLGRLPRRASTPAVRDRARVLLAFAIVFIAGTAIWLPLDWERFFLPALPALILLEVAVVTALARPALDRERASGEEAAPPVGP